MPVATIAIIAGAVKSTFDFLCTPEGQAVCKQWREDGEAFRAGVGNLAGWVEALVKSLK